MQTCQSIRPTTKSPTQIVAFYGISMVFLWYFYGISTVFGNLMLQVKGRRGSTWGWAKDAFYALGDVDPQARG